MSKTKDTGRVTPSIGRFRVTQPVTEEAIFHVLEGLNTPRSLTVWLLFKNKEHRQLVDLECHPDSYTDEYKFRDDYAATSLLSKSQFLETGIDVEAAALTSHHESERRCATYNGYFKDVSNHPLFKGDNVWMYNTFTRKMDWILGDAPQLKHVFDCCSWGPGATTLTKGVDTSSANKFQNDSGITYDLLTLLHTSFVEEFPSWFLHIALNQDWIIQNFNHVLTVDKNAKTKRLIAAEPALNVFFQKGLGEIIRDRLLRSCSIDIRDQTINQRLAHKASIDGEMATIDMKNASGHICRELVRESVPSDWYELLDSSRSRYGQLSGSVFQWENFSSMGNGFTFPLQTVIFYCAAYAACDLVGCPLDIGVYGDDVIIPIAAVQKFYEFCDFLGLVINQKKSFSSGWFRESCGSHWIRGVDVKPIFLKERLTTLDTLFALANNVRRLASRYLNGTGCDSRFKRCWDFLLRKVPKKFRFFVSEGYGDVGFIENFDGATPHVQRAKYQIEGYFCEVVSRVGLRVANTSFGLLLSRLSEASDMSRKNDISLRRVTRLKKHRVLVHRWRDLGPWC